MYCNQCGKPIPVGSAFCSHCGAAQPERPSQVNGQTISAAKSSGKGVKTAFYITLVAAVIAFGVFAYSTWIAPNNDIAASVTSDLPGTDLSLLSDWQYDEFSLENIANATEAQSADASESTTTTQPTTEPTAELTPEPTIHPIIGAWEGEEGGVYVAFEFLQDGTLRYFEGSDEYTYQYTIEEGSITLIEDGQAFTIVFYVFDGNETVTLTADGTPMIFSRVSMLNPPASSQTTAASQANAEQDPNVVFANGFVSDIEHYVAYTWWSSTGTWVNNTNGEAPASGYPKVYELASGQNQYIFDTQAMTIQMLETSTDGTVTDLGLYNYRLDPNGFYIYAFERTQNIDGQDYLIESKFFVCDDVLYEVEMVDGVEASNYIAYEQVSS